MGKERRQRYDEKVAARKQQLYWQAALSRAAEIEAVKRTRASERNEQRRAANERRRASNKR